MTQNNLGNALTTLGERESGTTRLEQAVAAYNEALKEYTRARVPLQWAVTQTNLGNALERLGEREPGNEHLNQAIAALRQALQEQTRERVPRDWAKNELYLGLALAVLGERTHDTDQLKEALTYLQQAKPELAVAGGMVQELAEANHKIGQLQSELTTPAAAGTNRSKLGD
jgi:tetratricopeptide (TPR) repeat protein